MHGSGVEIGKMLTKRWEECSAAVGVYVGCHMGGGATKGLASKFLTSKSDC